MYVFLLSYVYITIYLCICMYVSYIDSDKVVLLVRVETLLLGERCSERTGFIEEFLVCTAFYEQSC